MSFVCCISTTFLSEFSVVCKTNVIWFGVGKSFQNHWKNKLSYLNDPWLGLENKIGDNIISSSFLQFSFFFHQLNLSDFYFSARYKEGDCCDSLHLTFNKKYFMENVFTISAVSEVKEWGYVRRLSSDFHSGVKYINLVSNCKISLLWSHRRFRSFPISFSPRKFVSKGQRFLLTGTCCLCRWGWSPEADTLYLAVQCNL